MPDKLQVLFVKSIANEECQRKSEDRIFESHLCTMQAINKGICMADSGGPLVNLNGQVVGIVSFGIPYAAFYSLFNQICLLFKTILNFQKISFCKKMRKRQTRRIHESIIVLRLDSKYYAN